MPASGIRVRSVGDLVADGVYRAHSRFRRVVNATCTGKLVTLAVPGVDAGPLTIVADGVDPRRVRTIRIEERTLAVDGARARFGDDAVYRSEFEAGPEDLPLIARNLSVLAACVASRAPRASLAFLIDPAKLSEFRPGFERGLADHIGNCVRDIRHGQLLRGVSRLRGAGFGLTPSGDDFIAGLLLATHVIERTEGRDLESLRLSVLEAARTSNLLADAFLLLASEGRVFESMKALLGALSRGGPRDVTRCCGRLLEVGETSGADIAVGLLVTLEAGLSGSRASWPRAVTGRSVRDREAAWL